ncbi:MAG: NAD(P)H-dependent oxidoreductase [Candidatus Omnitrophica bacterium]|nr:NAD(P)H-dependent oxidoreductase [Candidatus Omnitrophota bacterium]
MTPQELVERLQWRYATKLFDPTKKIPDATWQALEQALVLSPSSYGLQPWKFLVLTDPTLRATLRTHSWNQAQVTDCSHFVVFLGKRMIEGADVERWVSRIAEVRGTPAASLTPYRDVMVGDLVQGPRRAIVEEWAARQVYIALGTLMMAAAMLEVDACPMEGIEPPKYDEVLRITGSLWRTLVACAVGYRAPTDKYATLPKVRYAPAEVVEHRSAP